LLEFPSHDYRLAEQYPVGLKKRLTPFQSTEIIKGYFVHLNFYKAITPYCSTGRAVELCPSLKGMVFCTGINFSLTPGKSTFFSISYYCRRWLSIPL
jgi:hypothetical protein